MNFLCNNRIVLVAVLDWGLGHATRIVPIIESLLLQNNTVIIASSGKAIQYLRQRFPSILFELLPAYNIRYSDSENQLLILIRQMPRIVGVIKNEHKRINRIVKKHSVSFIISDNRFGCYSKSIQSVFVTHQLSINIPAKSKLLTTLANKINAFYLNKYSECWIPDDIKYNLSKRFCGNRFITIPFKKIGFLSQFKSEVAFTSKKYDFLCILSGVEPQRTIFESKIISIFKDSKYSIALVCGSDKLDVNFPNIKCYSLLQHDSLLKLIQVSKNIICRSGYSSIMDLIIMKRLALLVPTPGQTEQEILAHEVRCKFGFSFLSQGHLSLQEVEKKIEEMDYKQ